MAKIEIRHANIENIEDILKLEDGFGDEKYSRVLIEQSLKDERLLNLIMFIDDVAIGYLSASVMIDEGELLKIIVDKDYRGKKLATSLMVELFNLLKEKGVRQIFLEVRKDNIPAKKLYEKLGFNKSHERKKYYSDGMDAEIYWCKLND